jgi:flavin-dependent dehydrogenase
MRKTATRITIVGGGASGVITAINLVRAMPHQAEITIIERRSSLGRGGRAGSPTHSFSVAPATLYGHAVSAIEIVCGMVFTAIMTGLLFVRFSKPRPKILLTSRVAGRGLARRVMWRWLWPR